MTDPFPHKLSIPEHTTLKNLQIRKIIIAGQETLYVLSPISMVIANAIVTAANQETPSVAVTRVFASKTDHTMDTQIFCTFLGQLILNVDPDEVQDSEEDEVINMQDIDTSKFIVFRLIAENKTAAAVAEKKEKEEQKSSSMTNEMFLRNLFRNLKDKTESIEQYCSSFTEDPYGPKASVPLYKNPFVIPNSRAHQKIKDAPKGEQAVMATQLVHVGDPTKFSQIPQIVNAESICLTKLMPSQSVDVTLIAAKGVGRQDPKFSPCKSFHRHIYDVKIPRITGKMAQDIKGVCPNRVFDIEDSLLVVRNNYSCTDCSRCAGYSSAISIERIDDTAAIVVDSYFQNSDTILQKAVSFVRRKYDV